MWQFLIAVLNDKVTLCDWGFKSSGNICPDIFWTTQHFLTKLNMLVHHNDLECHVKCMGSYLQGQGHSVGRYPKKNNLKLLQPNLVQWCIITSQCCVTILDCCAEGQGDSEGSSLPKNNFIPYLLKFLTFCNQMWYSGASTRARVLCDNSGLLCSRSRSQWGFKSSGNIQSWHWFTNLPMWSKIMMGNFIQCLRRATSKFAAKLQK